MLESSEIVLAVWVAVRGRDSSNAVVVGSRRGIDDERHDPAERSSAPGNRTRDPNHKRARIASLGLDRGFEVSRKVKLRLYVAGSAPHSIAALASMTAVRAALDDHELEIVDVLERPERALGDDVLVTPTLMKLSPRPPCRIVGDLSDTHQVLTSLGIVEGAA